MVRKHFYIDEQSYFRNEGSPRFDGKGVLVTYFLSQTSVEHRVLIALVLSALVCASSHITVSLSIIGESASISYLISYLVIPHLVASRLDLKNYIERT